MRISEWMKVVALLGFGALAACNSNDCESALDCLRDEVCGEGGICTPARIAGNACVSDDDCNCDDDVQACPGDAYVCRYGECQLGTGTSTN